MHQHYRTKGIVLSKRDSGEADQIFVLYTQDFGKIEVVGKAIRKITSKLRASIDVFYFIELEFIQGKNRKILTDAILLNKLSRVAKIFQIVEKLTTNQEKDEKIWSLIISVVKKLSVSDTDNNEIFFQYFLWNFFTLLGYSPELYTCTICAKKLLPEIFFLSPEHGGVVCLRCCNFPAINISVDSVKLIRFFIKEPIEKVEKLNVLEKDLEDLDKAFEAYFDFLAEKG